MATLAERQAFATSCLEKAKEYNDIWKKCRSDVAEKSHSLLAESEFARKDVNVFYAHGMVNDCVNDILRAKDFSETECIYEELLEWSVKLVTATKAFQEHSSVVIKNWMIHFAKIYTQTDAP